MAKVLSSCGIAPHTIMYISILDTTAFCFIFGFLQTSEGIIYGSLLLALSDCLTPVIRNLISDVVDKKNHGAVFGFLAYMEGKKNFQKYQVSYQRCSSKKK